MTVSIPLTRGLVAVVDAADQALVEAHSWHATKGASNRTWYARSSGSGPHATRKIIYMHRLVMAAPAGVLVDHINGDSLDNRRANLRFCNAVQNGANRAKKRGAASNYKGVYFENGAWRARIGPGCSHLGVFVTEVEAARAYDAAALRAWGAFARLNFPVSVAA